MRISSGSPAVEKKFTMNPHIFHFGPLLLIFHYYLKIPSHVFYPGPILRSALLQVFKGCGHVRLAFPRFVPKYLDVQVGVPSSYFSSLETTATMEEGDGDEYLVVVRV